VTPSEFVAKRPEFRTAGAAVGPTLLDAANRIDPAQFLETTDLAIELMAAHMLAISPFGRSQKLVNEKGETVYLTELNMLRKERIFPMLVT
jgi:hypothetical protein